MNIENKKTEILENGFCMINNVFSDEEIEHICSVIQNIDTSKDTFRKSEDLFAIRQFLKEIPEVNDLVFNENLKAVIKETRSALSHNSNFNFIHISFIHKNINELNKCESHYFA